jgi:peptide deformylase
MTVLAILRWPSNRLRDVSEPVTDEELRSESLRTLVRDMHETMVKRKGAGLSAIQVGVAKRLFLTRHDDSLIDPPTSIAFVNPVLVSASVEREAKDEGCLSMPGVFLPIERAKSVVLHALDLDGKKFTTEAMGTYARVLQHEMDHIGGKCIPDGLSQAQRDMLRRKLKSRKWTRR